MRRTLMLLAALLTFPAVGSADETADPLRALMPKEQVRLLENMEKATEMMVEAKGQTNGIKRKEGEDAAWQTLKGAAAIFTQDGKAEGLKGWAGKVSISTTQVQFVDSKRLVIFTFTLDGMPNDVKKYLRDVENGSVLRFDTFKFPKTAVPPTSNFGADKRFNFGLRFPGSALKSVGGAVR